MFKGSVDVDETYFGGRRHNMSNPKREALKGRGVAGKTAVVGAKYRDSNHVKAMVVESTDTITLQDFVADTTVAGGTVYTDEAAAYKGMPFRHASVKHSLREYVRGDVHTNGIESLWSMMKRAHKGTFHKKSPKHLNLYIQEFAARHNLHEEDTMDIMASMVIGMGNKRLRYQDLIKDNGLDPYAQA